MPKVGSGPSSPLSHAGSLRSPRSALILHILHQQTTDKMCFTKVSYSTVDMKPSNHYGKNLSFKPDTLLRASVIGTL